MQQIFVFRVAGVIDAERLGSAGTQVAGGVHAIAQRCAGPPEDAINGSAASGRMAVNAAAVGATAFELPAKRATTAIHTGAELALRAAIHAEVRRSRRGRTGPARYAYSIGAFYLAVDAITTVGRARSITLYAAAGPNTENSVGVPRIRSNTPIHADRAVVRGICGFAAHAGANAELLAVHAGGLL